MSNNKTVRTSDTALAAYLVSLGFGSPTIEYNGSKAFFIFDKSHKLDKAVDDFDTAQAQGNIVLFFNAYQALLRRIWEKR